MKKIFLAISLWVLTAVAALAQVAPQTLFPYPELPDTLTDATARTNRFVSTFWDGADLNRDLADMEKLKDPFTDWLSCFVMADADTVFTSVDRLMGRLADKPEQLYNIGRLAECYTYSDTASLMNDNLYLAFIKPVIRNQSLDRERRMRFHSQYVTLNNSLVGHPIASISATDRAGEQIMLEPDTSCATIIFMSDPDCPECSMARTRLRSNIKANDLIASGGLKIVALCQADPDEDWLHAAAEYPQNWIVATNSDLDTVVDLRAGTPSFYLVDRGILLAKHLSIDEIINILSAI